MAIERTTNCDESCSSQFGIRSCGSSWDVPCCEVRDSLFRWKSSLFKHVGNSAKKQRDISKLRGGYAHMFVENFQEFPVNGRYREHTPETGSQLTASTAIFLFVQAMG